MKNFLHSRLFPVQCFFFMLITILLIAISFLLDPLPLIQTYAQFDLETIKQRDLLIDLGEGIETKAQLTFPIAGNGPYPGVMLILGSGADEMNQTAGFI